MYIKGRGNKKQEIKLNKKEDNTAYNNGHRRLLTISDLGGPLYCITTLAFGRARYPKKIIFAGPYTAVLYI